MYSQELSEVYECEECNAYELNLHYLTEWFKGVVELSYSSDPLDPIDLENHLDEIAHYLGIKLPTSELQLTRKTSIPRINYLMEEWKEQNQKYLKTLQYTA